jgi:hypothetical protein
LQYGIWFPAIVTWWWWLGARIDFGIIGQRRYRYPKVFAGALATTSLGLIYVAVRESIDEFHWWMQYGRDSSLFGTAPFLRTIGPVIWWVILAGGCALASKRLIQLRNSQPDKKPLNPQLFLIVAAILLLYVFAIHRWDKSLNPLPNHDQCETDHLYGLGCIHGTVMDENAKPISHIEVDLIPIGKTGDARLYGTRSEWTDEQGKYSLNRMEPGEYLLGVNAFSAFGAPDAERPFATAYYPAAVNEEEAVPIRIRRSLPLLLPPIRLHKLEVAIIKVNVLWSDGTRPSQSNILFQNILYPHHGGTAPQINGGIGVYAVPKGFDYDIFASVECDAGNRIESRESLPYQRITVADGLTPLEMTFVIPGPRCALWKPQ